MKKLILLSGKAEAGKDSTADIMSRILSEKENAKCTKIALARELKYIAKDYFGWDGNKDEKGRQLLQWLGTEVMRTKLGPLFHAKLTGDIIKVLEDYYDYVFVTDVRFKNEFYYLYSLFPEKTISIKVERLNYENKLTGKQKEHKSEKDMEGFDKFDYVIKAESGLDNLEKEIIKTFFGKDGLLEL